MTHQLLVLSNRGPLSWRRAGDGRLVAHRGSGGLVSALAPALEATGGVWVAAALGPGDRDASLAAAAAPGPYRVRLLAFADDAFEGYATEISNRYVWFAHHDLWDRARTPVVDAKAYHSWNAYRSVNETFAAVAIEEATAVEKESGEAPVVLVQDYHLSLVPRLVKEERPDLTVLHFSHTPIGTISSLAVLPREWVEELLLGIAGADSCGFHTRRWADRFETACAAFVPDTTPRVAVHPLGPDPTSLALEASSEAVARERRLLEDWLQDRRAIVRIDRAELSKNVLRGLAAFRELLERRDDMRSEVAHIVLLNPSRQALQEYRDYLADCRRAVDRLNADFDEVPVLLFAEDRYPRSLAAMSLADVFVVNPISDGMNLVAKEGPLVNEREAPLVLSTEAGAIEELAPACLPVNPYDVTETSLAIEHALDLPADERSRRHLAVCDKAGAHRPADWLTAQLEGVGR